MASHRRFHESLWMSSGFDVHEISRLLKEMFPPYLAEGVYLEEHVILKYQPILDFLQQEYGNNLQLSGSLAEWMYIDFVDRKYIDFEVRKYNRKPLCQSDMDILWSRDSRPVYTTTEQSPVGLVLDTSGCSPGYTRIKDISSGIYALSQSQTLGQPADEKEWDYVYNRDCVPYFRCNSWDVSISSVLNRITPSAWPTAQQLEELKATSILLVHKIDPARNHENLRQYFRFSFSLPEKVLCRSLPHCFRYIYLCTKVIVKYFCAETELKSYYMKTTLFHFLEENYHHQNSFSALPGLGVIKLIKKIQLSFMDGQLLNFFVPEMNLIEEIEESKRQQVVEILENILSEPERKIWQLNQAVAVQDYRRFDDAVGITELIRKEVAEIYAGERTSWKFLGLLERQTSNAPNVQVILLTLLHVHLLREETEKATKILKRLDRMSEKRIEVVKLEPRHSSLFLPTTSSALNLLSQPVYLDSVDYERYLRLIHSKQTKDYEYRRHQLRLIECWCRETPSLALFKGMPITRKQYELCKLALYVDMLELLDSQYTNKAREKYEQFTGHVPRHGSD